MSRGIACVKDEKTTTFWRNAPQPDDPYGYASNSSRGRKSTNNGRAVSPYSVDSSSDEDDFPRSPSPVTELIPTVTSRVVLTISLRRPPRFQVPITNKNGHKMHVDDGKRRIRKRQATSWDFVDNDELGKRDCEEADAGALSVWAEQETFKVRHVAAV
jgi:hypothetical protein